MKVLVLVKASKEGEVDVLQNGEEAAAMDRYNDDLVNAGIRLAAEGLQVTSKGKRVRFEGDKRTVIDGPFTEAKEWVAGFWIWQVKSMDEAIEWAKRAPFQSDEVEIRKIHDAEDFAPSGPSDPPAN